MVTAVDESLGRLRKALKEKGIADNTIILFTSDQGGYFSNYPLRGKKLGGHTLGEGGARVPFVLYWPGKTKAGRSGSKPAAKSGGKAGTGGAKKAPRRSK